MTLIEVFLAVVIMSIIASAIATAMITSLNTVGSTSDRFSQSHDNQLLSSWLITDLQSASPGSISTTATSPTGCTTGPADASNVLALTWTDYSGPTTYHVDYRIEAVNGAWVLERYYCVGATPATSFVVVHNLSTSVPNPAVATVTTKYVTMTITTNGPNKQPYTFSVSGGGRVGTPGIPVELSATSRDINNDGAVDEIDVLFNRSLNPCSASCSSYWHVSGQPGTTGTVSPTAVAIGNSQYGINDLVQLTLAEQAFVDTVAPSLTVSVDSNKNDVTSVSGTPVAFGPVAVSDGMAPVLCIGTLLTEPGGCSGGVTPPTSIDANHDGKLDGIQMTFSEPIATPTFAAAPWTLTNNPGWYPSSGVSPVDATDTAISTTSSKVLDLAISESYTDPTTSTVYNEVVDTAASGMQLTLAAVPGGVVDSNGNAATFSNQPVSDGMSPVLMAVSLNDGSTAPTPGIIDSGDIAVFTFSEPNLTGLPGSTASLNVTGNATAGQPESFDIPGFWTVTGTNTVDGLSYAAGTLTLPMPCTGSADTTNGNNEWDLTCTVGGTTPGTPGQALSSPGITFDTSPPGITDTAHHQAMILGNVPISPASPSLYF